MSDPRRYDEAEVARIFEQASLASESRATSPARADGMTLAELQDIGQEVGLSADQITRAARSIDIEVITPPKERRWLGLPVGVTRTVELDRPVNDEEWTRLVFRLRDTFGARGQTTTEGPFREWHNGNLRVLLEPTEQGHRLHLSTRKGDAQIRVIMAGMYTALTGMLVTLGSLGVIDTKGAVIGGLLFGGAAVFATLSSIVGLPRWAKLRSEQMEAIATELRQTVVGSGNASVPTIPSSTS